MKYTLKVELEVDIEFLNRDELDEDTQEEINDIVTAALSDNSFEISQKIFQEMHEHTNVDIHDAITFEEKVEKNYW
jgi:hypothetical protein